MHIINTRVINKYILPSLSYELTLQSWDDIVNLRYVNLTYGLFINTFTGLVNKRCPIEIFQKQGNIFRSLIPK